MFADSVRIASARILLRLHFKEGVEASIALYPQAGKYVKEQLMKEWAKLGSSVETVEGGETIRTLIQQYVDSAPKWKNLEARERTKKEYEDNANANAVLKAFSDKNKPAIQFESLK